MCHPNDRVLHQVFCGKCQFVKADPETGEERSNFHNRIQFTAIALRKFSITEIGLKRSRAKMNIENDSDSDNSKSSFGDIMTITGLRSVSMTSVNSSLNSSMDQRVVKNSSTMNLLVPSCSASSLQERNLVVTYFLKDQHEDQKKENEKKGDLKDEDDKRNQNEGTDQRHNEIAVQTSHSNLDIDFTREQLQKRLQNLVQNSAMNFDGDVDVN